MLDDVETIKNDFCVWKELASQWNISSRHIHRDKLYLLPDFQWILQKVVSYSSLAAIIKDGYELVCLIILRHKSQFPFLEPKLIPGHKDVYKRQHQEGLTFDKGVFEELLVKSSFDFSDIQKNLAFLKGYKTEGNISSQDITEAIPKSLQDNIFDMTQLLLRGQIQDVRELVHDLRLQGEDEIKLIAVMLGQFRTYLQVKLLSAQGKSEQQIVSSLSDYLSRKVNPFQVRYAIRDSRHLSVAFLKTTIKTLVETDYQIKTGTLDKDYLLDLALLKIASNS